MLGVQIIIVSGESPIAECADKIFEVGMTDGISCVEENE